MQICSAKRGLWVTGGHRTISWVLFTLFHLVFHFFLGNKIKKHLEGRPRVSVRPRSVATTLTLRARVVATDRGPYRHPRTTLSVLLILVCMLCMYVVYVCYVCMLCMYVRYVC